MRPMTRPSVRKFQEATRRIAYSIASSSNGNKALVPGAPTDMVPPSRLLTRCVIRQHGPAITPLLAAQSSLLLPRILRPEVVWVQQLQALVTRHAEAHSS